MKILPFHIETELLLRDLFSFPRKPKMVLSINNQISEFCREFREYITKSQYLVSIVPNGFELSTELKKI